MLPQIQTRLQQQNEQLREELESAHKKSTQQLQSKLTELEASNRELTERKYKNESTIRDLKIKLVGAEEVRASSAARGQDQMRTLFVTLRKLHCCKQHCEAMYKLNWV